VHPDGGLGQFTEISVGDVVELMIGTPEPRVVRKAVSPRALGRIALGCLRSRVARPARQTGACATSTGSPEHGSVSVSSSAAPLPRARQSLTLRRQGDDLVGVISNAAFLNDRNALSPIGRLRLHRAD
jgi:hypothetical protein